MADTKISALTDGGVAQITDTFPVVRSGANRKVTGVTQAYDIRSWCVADGSTDDVTAFGTALAAAAGKPLLIPTGVTVRLDTKVSYTGAVDLRIEGAISHSRNGGLAISQTLTSLGAISAFATTQSPSGFGATDVSRITLTTSPPADVKRGAIILVVSTDTYSEDSGVRLGELARVESVSGSDVVLSHALEFTYTTSPAAHLLTEGIVSITGSGKVYNPNYLTENTGATGSALELIACTHPQVKVNFADQANTALQLTSCWMPVVDVDIRNQRNAQTDSSYGYGVVCASATAYARIKLRAYGSRHAFDADTFSGAGSAYQNGAPKYNEVFDSVAYGCLSHSFNTHEAAYYTRFVNCVSDKRTGNQDYTSETTQYAFYDRGAGTQIIGGAAYGLASIYLGGAQFNRAGAAGKYETLVDGLNCFADKNTGWITTKVVAAYDATVGGYHRITIKGGVWDRVQVTLDTASPETVIDGLVLSEQQAAFGLGGSNVVAMTNVRRSRASGALPNITVGPGTTLSIDGYTADAASYTNNTLIYATGGAGTATVRLGQLFMPQGDPTTYATDDATTTLALSYTGSTVTGQVSAVDGEIALFSGTGGNLIKRATTTGLLKASSGVIAQAVADTDYSTPTITKFLAETTWASKPAASSNTGKIIPVTNVGNTGLTFWFSDGSNWRLMGPRDLIVINDGAAGTTSISEQVLSSCPALPAGVLTSLRYFVVKVLFAKSGTTDTSTARIRMGTANTTGATVIYSAPLTAANRSYTMDAYAFASSSTQVRYFGQQAGPGGFQQGGTASAYPSNITVSDMSTNDFYFVLTQTMSGTTDTPQVPHVVVMGF